MKKFSLIIFLFNWIFIFSQKNDSIVLFQNIDSVVISSQKLLIVVPTVTRESEFNISEYISSKTLDDILDNNTKISIKKYGEGQLSTISVKGFNATHTDVLWNGVKLNSPMLGQADLSTVNIGNNNKLSLSENRTENISGAIFLNNRFNFQKEDQLKIASDANSYGNFRESISFEFSRKFNFYSNTNVSFNYFLNKYKYVNKSLPNQKEIYLDNSEVKSIHFEQINAFKFKNENELRLFFKTFYSDRNIAPSVFEFSSSKNQKDNLFLGKIEWLMKDIGKRFSLKLNSSVTNLKQEYKLSNNSNTIYNNAKIVQSNFNLKKQILNRSNFSFSLNNELENGSSNNYSNSIWRNKLNIKPEFYFVKRISDYDLIVRTSLNEILQNNKFSKPLPKISISYFRRYLPSDVLVKLNYSRRVKFPSLNDLHWNPGGNINLEEEYAHSFSFIFGIERHFNAFKNNKKLYFKNNIELFNIFVDNYIQWQPTNSGFWQPSNIGKVSSRGFTNDFTLKYKLNKYNNFENNFSYNFTRITKYKELEQLIYVPLSSFYNSTKIATRWLHFNINQQYVSKKFTNYDNTLALNNYYLLDLELSKEFYIRKKNIFKITFATNNVFNTTYFTYINRALPRRNYSLKLSLTFNKYILDKFKAL